MKRILVVGCPGSGKSTFARALQAKLGLPVVYLDNLFWNADRTHVSSEQLDARLAEALRQPAWILDGNYSRTLEPRLAACDTVFFLDYPLEVCLAGIRQRRGSPRPDLPWVESADLSSPEYQEFEQYVRDFAVQQLPLLRRQLAECGKNVITFTARAQAEAYLAARSTTGEP